VALAVHPVELVANDPAQLQMEADVRRMLRRANDVLRLAAFPLAQSLCEISGISNAQQALRHVVETAFRGVWPETRLRDLLLTADLEGRIFRGEAAAQLQVSTRHLQRRRAKAVSILALHIRKLLGPDDVETIDETRRAPADALEMIAELVSDIEPAVAARILRLGGPQSAEKANALVLRGRVDAGADPETAGAEFGQRAFSPLLTILQAQSKQMNGKQGEADQGLWPLFTRAARDTTESSEVQFELEWLAFLRARHRGCVRQMQRVVTNLSRIAQETPAWISRSLLAQAEARIRRGRLQDAIILLDQVERRGFRRLALRQLASSSVLRAEIALQHGDDAAAERLAAGADAILRGRHSDAYRAQATLARASLRLRKPWPCGDEVGSLSATAWDRVAIDIEAARHYNVDGQVDFARQCARESYRIASNLNYLGLAARAAATIGSTFDERSRRRRDWYLRALSHLLSTGDRSVGCDLFGSENDAAPFVPFDEGISEVLYRALTRAIPQLSGSSSAQVAAARDFLRRLSEYALGLTPFTDELAQSMDVAAHRSGPFAQYLTYFLDDATDILECAFAAIVSIRKRAGMDQRLTHVLRGFAGAVEPDKDVRRFIVG
jgi:hypothetical protein